MTGHRLCARCRAAVHMDDPMTTPPGWIARDDGCSFCSMACAEKGSPVKVRKVLYAHLDFDLGTPIQVIAGFSDAIHGYDCLSTCEEYVLGHTQGLLARLELERTEAFLQAMGLHNELEEESTQRSTK